MESSSSAINNEVLITEAHQIDFPAGDIDAIFELFFLTQQEKPPYWNGIFMEFSVGQPPAQYKLYDALKRIGVIDEPRKVKIIRDEYLKELCKTHVESPTDFYRKLADKRVDLIFKPLHRLLEGTDVNVDDIRTCVFDVVEIIWHWTRGTRSLKKSLKLLACMSLTLPDVLRDCDGAGDAPVECCTSFMFQFLHSVKYNFERHGKEKVTLALSNIPTDYGEGRELGFTFGDRNPETNHFKRCKRFRDWICELIDEKPSNVVTEELTRVICATVLATDDHKVKLMPTWMSKTESVISSNKGTTNCVICLQESAGYTLIPCGHECLCSRCLKELQKSDELKCPVCRATFETAVKDFVKHASGVPKRSRDDAELKTESSDAQGDSKKAPSSSVEDVNMVCFVFYILLFACFFNYCFVFVCYFN